MKRPLSTPKERAAAVALLILWAALFLPHLRTNPNWYGDEGEWMDASWSLIHGHPRVDAVRNDFVFPYPYPPLYLLVNGALLRVFGNDLLVARALGAALALGAAALLFWIGSRLRDRMFGFLCAAAFLVYPVAVTNFRWARGHTMAGVLTLAAVGFLVRYVQEKRLRDAVLAGVMASLATATVYWAWPVVIVVVLTVLAVNRRHAAGAAVAACGYAVLFVAAYGLLSDGGWSQLAAQARRLNPPTDAPWSAELIRLGRNYATFFFATPAGDPEGMRFVDLWLAGAAVGIVALPFAGFRKWFALWLLILPYAVFRARDNVSIFIYPAMVFLPLLAVPFAGLLVRLGEWADRLVAGMRGNRASAGLAATGLRWAPAAIGLGIMGFISLSGSLGHFRTPIDRWTQHSAAEAQAAMDFVNANTTAEDSVIVPKQVCWMVRHARKCMLALSLNYEGQTTDMWPTLVPKDRFWFDCRWRKARYIVLASGLDAGGRKQGFDLVFSRSARSFSDTIAAIMAEKWPVVFPEGDKVVRMTVEPGKQWPVVVGGEYVVLENPSYSAIGVTCLPPASYTAPR